jgi:hypothetical protein
VKALCRPERQAMPIGVLLRLPSVSWYMAIVLLVHNEVLPRGVVRDARAVHDWAKTPAGRYLRPADDVSGPIKRLPPNGFAILRREAVSVLFPS